MSSGCGTNDDRQNHIRLTEPSSGSICFKNKDIAVFNRQQLKEMRRCMQIIFQDPYSSLDPRVVIGDSIQRGLDIHNIGSKRERKEKVIEALQKVGLKDYHLHR